MAHKRTLKIAEERREAKQVGNSAEEADLLLRISIHSFSLFNFFMRFDVWIDKHSRRERQRTKWTDEIRRTLTMNWHDTTNAT
jgi:hypothetical protein